MANVPEPTETQAAAVAAELAATPDGSHVVCFASPLYSFQARAHLVADSPHAVVLCGPAAFACTFAQLARTLAARGASTLVVHPRPTMTEADALACGAAFLRHRGARTLSLAAAGACARAALESACPLDAEGLLLLAPSQVPDVRADLLRGRPLLVCTSGERRRIEPLSRLPHAEHRHFALACESFDEVCADLLAACVPFLAGRQAAVACLHP